MLWVQNMAGMSTCRVVLGHFVPKQAPRRLQSVPKHVRSQQRH
jgi:hypothetical protein